MRKSRILQQVLLLCAVTLFTTCYFYRLQVSNQSFGRQYNMQSKTYPTVKGINTNQIKYVLQWIKPHKEPYSFLKEGQDTFLERNCPVNNCYVTSNRSFFSDMTNYNAILFNSGDLSIPHIQLPKNRSSHQRYVFASTESAASYRYVYHKNKDIFNLTWTYKLNSDIFYGYISIRNKKGELVGPKEVMHWPKVKEMEAVSNELKQRLDKKTTAAAWFVSNCRTLNRREWVARKLARELARYNMTLDIYGACGTKKCPVSNMTGCLQKLERDYYFYLSFENSLSEDYVTEKLLNALQHYAVPIVYGGANYTRFMPDGIYLNVKSLNARSMAKKMRYLINNKNKYYDYFRWHNHYIYEYAGKTPDTDFYCNFCKKLNDVDEDHEVKVYKDIIKWWQDSSDDNKGFIDTF